MIDQYRAFPTWVAPIFGAIYGCFMGLKVMGEDKKEFVAFYPIAGGLVGLVAGFVIVYFDFSQRKAQQRWKPLPKATILGKTLAVLGIVGVGVPVFGVLLTGAAYYANRRTDDWPRRASVAALWISLIMGLGIFYIVAFPNGIDF